MEQFAVEALGGPTTYSDSYGDETTVVKMHSGNGKRDEMNRRAIAFFDLAPADVGLANDHVFATSAARLFRLGDHDNDGRECRVFSAIASNVNKFVSGDA